MAVLNDLNLTDLQTLKSWIGLNANDLAADNVLASLIQRVSSVMLVLLSRKYFVHAQRTEVFRGNGKTSLLLDARPVTQIHSPTTTTRTFLPAPNYVSSGYVWDKWGITLQGDVFYPEEQYTLDYSGGYSTSSKEALAVEHAVLSACNLWYKRKGHADQISMTQGNQITTKFIEDAIPAETKMLIDALKRVG